MPSWTAQPVCRTYDAFRSQPMASLDLTIMLSCVCLAESLSTEIGESDRRIETAEPIMMMGANVRQSE